MAWTVALALAFEAASGAPRTVRVGVYDNPPKIRAEADGRPGGILGELLAEIATREGWTLEPVPCAWEACLQALAEGRIDLLPDVAYTEERARRFDFHAEPALNSWSAVYAPARVRIESVLDLKGLRIAVLRGSVQQAYLEGALDDFGVVASLVPVATLEEGFALAGDGQADAAVANQFFGESRAPTHGLRGSALMFQPARLYYATARGANADLRAAIDTRLRAWKAEPGSTYDIVLRRWAGAPSAVVWPWWLAPVLAGLGAAVAATLALNALLRRRVRQQMAAREQELTLRRQAEEGLARQHHLLRTLIRAIPDPVWLKDPQGVYLACNARFEDLFGAAEADILGRRDADFVAATRASEFRVRDQQAVDAGRAVVHEDWVVFARGGERALLEVTKAPLHDDAGRLIGILGTAHDITRRKRIEAELRESQERLRALYEGAPDGILLADVQTRRFIQANGVMCTMLGYPLEELLALGVEQMHPPEVVPVALEAFARHARGQEGGSVELTMRRKDGSVFPAEVTVAHLHIEDRHYLAGFFRDITARRQDEARLRDYQLNLERLVAQRTDELNTLFLAVPDLYFRMDAEGRLLDFRAGAGQELYAPPEQFLGRRMDDVMPPDPAQRLAEAAREVVQQQVMRSLEYTLPMPQGEQTYEARLVPLRGDQVVAVVRNVSERKRVEAQLQAAREAAEAASVAKSAFLANMSHEIRTPMNGILGMAQVIRRAGVTPAQARQLDTLDAAGRHLLGVIDAVLDLSKIEAGKLALEDDELRLAALLDNVAAMVGAAAAAKGLEVVVEPVPELPALRGDTTRLQQALLNFASNAVKFTERGRVVLRTAIEAEEPEALRLRFEVEDTGIGIAPEALDQLFRAFEQADNSITRRYGGTGLGLVITQKLAETMGGAAGARSVPGAGSTFWFTVRLRRGGAPGEGAAPEGAGDDAEAALRQRRHPLRVLVAEDEPVNREVIVALLAGVCGRVDLAADGAEAVQRVTGSDYDLVLMDVQMPTMDGLEATRRIRALDRGRALPILAMTASAFEEDRRRCLEAGMNDFVSKPTEPPRLFALLRRWAPPDS